MTARIVTAVAVVAWLVVGLVAARGLVTAPAAADVVDLSEPSPTEVVAILGLAQLAAGAHVEGDTSGAAAMAELPTGPGVGVPDVRDEPHYVEDLTVVDLRADGRDWVVTVRVDNLAGSAAGWTPAAPVLVSVPVTAHASGFALAGQPLIRPVDTVSAGAAG